MKTRLLLTGIILFGFFIRSIGLEIVPPALNSDELLKAYDGASVFRTGKDHHGESWPLFFRQSGEYSPPLYIYFVGIFSASFGIDAYTVRLPSAILGTLSIILTYLFMVELYGKRAGLIAAVLVSISPWNIHYSRIGWEVISLIPLQLAGLYNFFRWIRMKKATNALFFTLFFSLTFYAYPTARAFIPLLLFGLALLYFLEFKTRKLHLAYCFIIFLVLIAPYIWSLIHHYHAMQARWMFLSVFEQENGWNLFLQHYLLHLSPMFLFFTGDPNPHHPMIGGVGLAVLFPFFLLGFVSMFQKKDRCSVFFLYWFLVFSIPSAMTFDRYDLYSMPNSLRSACGMPLIEIISTIGFLYFYECFKSNMKQKWITALFSICLIINTAVVGIHYFLRAPIDSAPAFQYGIRELVKYSEANKHKYDHIVISPNVRLHPIYLATFSGRPPSPFSGEDYPEYIIPFYHYVPNLS